MLISCSRCGRIHKDSVRCIPIRRKKLPLTDEQVLRNKSSWHKKAEAIKERQNYLCAICKQLGDYSSKALETHHITKLRDDPNGLLADDNLIALCIAHHKQADRGEIKAETLRHLARVRDGLEPPPDDETGIPPEGSGLGFWRF